MADAQNSAQEAGDNKEPESNAEDVHVNEDMAYEPFSDDIDPIGASEQDFPDVVSIDSADNHKIATLENDLSKTKDALLRAVAEAENARKRAVKDREDASKFAVSRFSKDILSVADNLRRALDSVPADMLEQNPQIKNLTDGIDATERELLHAFEKHGIQKIEPLDTPFNPNFHEVMFEAPIPDKPNGTVIQVIEPGYTLNGRILRPARVGVAKNENTAQANSSGDTGQTIDTEA